MWPIKRRVPHETNSAKPRSKRRTCQIDSVRRVVVLFLFIPLLLATSFACDMYCLLPLVLPSSYKPYNPQTQSQNSTRLVLLCAISRAVSLARGALFFCLFVLFRKGGILLGPSFRVPWPSTNDRKDILFISSPSPRNVFWLFCCCCSGLFVALLRCWISFPHVNYPSARHGHCNRGNGNLR